MGKLLYLRSAPPVRHRRWRRSPLYWAWRNACEGWCGAAFALARARPRDAHWHGPPVDF